MDQTASSSSNNTDELSVCEKACESWRQMERFFNHLDEEPRPPISTAGLYSGEELDVMLLFAVDMGRSIENVEALIKLGANVNAQSKSWHNETPLFKALSSKRSHEMVCMLLYYGADINIANVKRINEHHILLYATCNDDVNLFRLVWETIDPEILTKFDEPFLYLYLKNATRFTPSDWLECLYLILGSPVAKELAADAKTRYSYSSFGTCGNYLFHIVLERLREMKIKHKDRTVVIYLLSSLDFAIHVHDLESLYCEYGFKEELQAILYCARICTDCSAYCGRGIYNEFVFRMGYSLNATQEDLNRNKLFKYFKSELSWHGRPKLVLRCLRLFSLPSYMKRDLYSLTSAKVLEAKQHRKKCYRFTLRRIMKKLETVSEIPTLLELSRDQVRTFIRKNLNIRKPYHFYHAIKNVGLPKKIEDIVCFKTPLY